MKVNRQQFPFLLLDISLSELALVLVGSAAAVLALEDELAVLVQSELGDLDLAGINADGDGGAYIEGVPAM